MNIFKIQRHTAVVLMVTALLCVQAALPERTRAVGFDPAVYARIDANGKSIIHLPAGTYTVSRTIKLSSDTVLEGEGDATVLTPGTGFTGMRFITNQDPARGNRNIVLRNLQIRFAGPAFAGYTPGIVRFYHAENLAISNVTMVVDSPMYAIDLSNQIQNAAVEGCTITNTNRTSGGAVMIRNGDALSTQATSSVLIRNNNFTSVSDEPISLFGWRGEVANVTVQGNAVHAHGASFGIVAYGVDARDQSGRIHDVRIIDNTVSGGRVGGIGVKGGAQAVEVSGNTVEDTEGDGIFLHTGGEGLPGVRDIRIQRNGIVNAGRHGMFVSGENIEVKQNTINRCGQSGIFAAGYLSVTGNTVTDARPGILVYGGREESINGNTLRNDGRILILNKDGSVLKNIMMERR